MPNSIITRQELSVDCSGVKHKIESRSQYDLSILAMLACKWLSDRRMLFSPAHLQIGREHKSRILVLDGLGDGMCVVQAYEFITNVFVFQNGLITVHPHILRLELSI